MPKSKRLKLANSGERTEAEGDPANGCSGTSSGANIPVEESDSNSDDDYNHISDDEEGGMRIGDIYIPPASKPTLTFDPTGPRMIITHIVNENFKSYAGTQYLGPFHKSFTSIIGPNGSGKSNVIDSMLFVFGYRSARIRSKNISLLIHSSSKFPSVKSATVTVHFCQIIDEEGGGCTVVPDSQIVVSRTALRDNTSFYTLNGERVQFKKVSSLLQNYGIDLKNNRFLILQGEVELISMMKPKAVTENESGMLEYLEDIIGTGRYKKPLSQLSEKVETLTESRKEKLNRVRVAEIDKERLEQPMKNAVEVINLANRLAFQRNMLFQKYSFDLDRQIQAKLHVIKTIQSRLEYLDHVQNTNVAELNEKNLELKEGNKKYAMLHKLKENLEFRAQTYKKKLTTLVSDIGLCRKKKKNLDYLLGQERTKLMEYELVPEKNTREIAECEKLLEKHNENKRKADNDLQTVLTGIRTKTQGLQENKDRLQGKLIGLKRIVDETNKSVKLAESELKIYLSTEQKETEKLENMKENFETANRDLREKKGIQQQVSSTLPDNERELNQLKTELENIKREETSVLNEARTLRSQLEESRQAMTANRSRGRVLDSLMREKLNGNLPGIYGRMGDLGGIDAKYDVAISTCCGALDNIVVDTVETAQACVEYLKRNDIGRATFIALDKQMHLKQIYQKRQTFPENVPRLFDLIKVKDQRVLPAFYYALRDTLVANDLDQASRIAYGATRYRVVSLKGDVIEIAGTMAGGGKSTMRGRMSSSVQQDTSVQDPGTIKANEKKLSAMEKRLLEMRAQQASKEDALAVLQTTVREGRMTLNKVNVELRSLTEHVPLIQNQIRQQESKVAACRVDEERKTQLEAALNDAKEKLDQAKHDAAEVEKEVQDVDAKILACAGERVNDIQKHVTDLSNKISKVTTEINKLNVFTNTSVRNVKKSRDKIAQIEVDYAETDKKMENLIAQKNQLSLDSLQLQKNLELIEEQISEGSDEFTELKREILKLENDITKSKNARIDIIASIAAEEKAIIECRLKLPDFQKELSRLAIEVVEKEASTSVSELEEAQPLLEYSFEELDLMNTSELEEIVIALVARLGSAVPNTQAVNAFRTAETLYLQRVADLELITFKRNELRVLHDELKKRRQTEFLGGFNTITAKLKEMYQMITLGGDAELEMVDSLDPFTEGIIFSVRPPNKSWKNISNLSGGEKTLSSLALVFALHYYKPNPLYVMDEIDAALDFKNVSIVANYIKDRTKNAQFIIISLRYIMFEISNRLVGIYKTNDCTRCVTIDNVQPLPINPNRPLSV